MKKTSKKQNRNAKAAVAATMMAMPILSMPATGIAQKSPTTTETTTTTTTTTRIKSPIFKFESVLEKHKGDLWIAGIGDGHTIYENSRGEYFYIDPNTGDMKTVTGKHFDKVEIRNLRYAKWKDVSLDGADIKSTGAEKQQSKITLVGVDAQGNVIEMNSRGEKFYLNTVTGDMVFVK